MTIRPTLAPLRSISALVATVLLWVWTQLAPGRAIEAERRRISSTPSRMLAPGRAGVLGTLKQCSSPDAG